MVVPENPIGTERMVEASFSCTKETMRKLLESLHDMEDRTRFLSPTEAEKILDICTQIEDTTKELRT